MYKVSEIYSLFVSHVGPLLLVPQNGREERGVFDSLEVVRLVVVVELHDGGSRELAKSVDQTEEHPDVDHLGVGSGR
jgi:hypothetical protein